MEPILTIQNLSKRYGAIQAVNNLSLEINRGERYGILGPNGSGKTTTLAMVLGVVNPDAGSAQWFGGMQPEKSRKKIGAILEKPCFYPYLNAVQNLQIVCTIKQVNQSDISRVLDIVGLTSRQKSKYSTFSLGMKQRLAVASALLGNPEVLLLDEPTNGLDPQGIAEMRSIIKEVGLNGTSVIMASHILDEVEKVCTHIAVLKNGNLIGNGKINDIVSGQEQICIASDNLEVLKTALHEYGHLASIKQDGNRFMVKLLEKGKAGELSQYLNGRGVIVTEFTTHKISLEDQFLEMVK